MLVIRNRKSMKSMRVILIGVVVVLAALTSIFRIGASGKNKEDARTDVAAIKLDVSDTVRPVSLPAIGKWMYQDDGQRAHWLGVKWEGKDLIEPINIILIDKLSKTAEEAKDRIYDDLKRAGYLVRRHHSSGYRGYIGGKLYPQIPEEKYRAFSNGPAEIDNNHGRIFGPHYYKNAFIFTAAFSREEIVPTAKIEHQYASFDRARDNLAYNLNKRSDYKIVGFVNLDNAILGNGKYSTGDHDGVAVVLSAGP